MCKAANNECDIQCGAGQYRHGHFCYHCGLVGEGSACQLCDGKGGCTACSEGYGLRNGECRSLEQIGLDAVAETLAAQGRTGCTSPDMLTCLAETCAAPASCGTFEVELDAGRTNVATLFVTLSIIDLHSFFIHI